MPIHAILPYRWLNFFLQDEPRGIIASENVYAYAFLNDLRSTHGQSIHFVSVDHNSAQWCAPDIGGSKQLCATFTFSS